MLIDIYEAKSGLIVLGEFPDASIFQAIEDSGANKFSLVVLSCDNDSDKLHEYLNHIERFCVNGTVVYVFGEDSCRKNRPLHKLIVKAEEHTSWTFNSMISGSSFGEVAGFYLHQTEIKDESINKFTGKKRMFWNTKSWINPAELFDSLYNKYGMEKIIEMMIRTHTKKGDWIFDPMSKRGTIATVASKMGRNFVCIEEDCEDFVFAIESIKNA